MQPTPYAQLVRYKQWADRGLCDVAAEHFGRLDAGDSTLLLRILDHIHVVDRIFQHHLAGQAHAFGAPRSDTLPDLGRLAAGLCEIDDWYTSYVDGRPASDFEQPVAFAFTDGAPGRMTRGDILLHVCLHGTYHRGNAGVILQKNGIAPNDDRITDFLNVAA